MSRTHRSEMSRLLSGIDHSEPPRAVLDRVFQAVERELRQLAGNVMRSERAGDSLQPTVLVHEAYLRLVDENTISIHGRSHFFGIAARTMRRILVDRARSRGALKRGGDWNRVALTGSEAAPEEWPDILDLDDALTQLASLDPRMVKVVEYRVFGGLTMEEIAQLLGVTRRTVQNDWRIARMWMRSRFAEYESYGS